MWSAKQTWRVCEQYSRFGLPLHFTETTIVSGDRMAKKKGEWPSNAGGRGPPGPGSGRFLYPALLPSGGPGHHVVGPQRLAFVVGGPAGLIRSDMTPKPAYDELKRLIKGKWWTKTQLRSDADGTAAFRGFLGDYRLTVRMEGKPAIVKQVSLARGKANRFTITIP